jgi:hypothetical protein
LKISFYFEKNEENELAHAFAICVSHVAFTQMGLLPEQHFIGIAVAKPLSVEQHSNHYGTRIAKERLVLVPISLENLETV